MLSRKHVEKSEGEDSRRSLTKTVEKKTHSAGSERRHATLSPVHAVPLSIVAIAVLSAGNPLMTCVSRRTALVPVD